LADEALVVFFLAEALAAGVAAAPAVCVSLIGSDILLRNSNGFESKLDFNQ
jgi:hypothetical protein